MNNLKIFLLSIFSILALSANAEDDNVSFSIDDVTIKPGETVKCSVRIKSTIDIAAIQFDINLPEGVGLTTTKTGTYKPKLASWVSATHSLSTNIINNQLKIMVFSLDDEALEPNEGLLFNFYIIASESAVAGKYTPTVSGIVVAPYVGTQKIVLSPFSWNCEVKSVGSVPLVDADGNVIGMASSVNEAINMATSTASTVKLMQDSNVGSATLATPTSPVVIDLNGYGLLVDGAPADITGNANVKILLKDANNKASEYGTDQIAYTNKSKVTGSPIIYSRTFSDVQKGKWQSLYLPFNAQKGDLDLGKATLVNVSDAPAVLVDKNVSEINANTCYFIRSNRSEIQIVSSDDELKPAECTSTAVGTFDFKGCVTPTDEQAAVDGAFWVINNSGVFIKAKAGSHQRPYRWVVYDNGSLAGKSLGMQLFTLGEDYSATGIKEINAGNAASEVYTLDGRKLTGKSLKSGIYVKGGQKVVVK